MTVVEEMRPVSTAAPVSILIVDDNPSKRVALRAVLNPLGHRIVEAESGFAALRSLMAQDFAVILLDVQMPEMNGFETAALVRQRSRSELTPIIFITAYRVGDLEAGEFVQGIGEVMYSPVDTDELRRKVATFAELHLRSQLDEPVGVQAAVLDARAATNQIIATSRLLLDSNLDHEQHEKAASVHGTAEALLALLDATAGHIQAPAESQATESRATGRILVVEDNLVCQRLTVMLLTDLGYHVDVASDGAAAVQIASTRTYDAILMDCHMPKLSGYEAAAALALLAGTGRRAPIVAMTGSSTPGDRARAVAGGMDGYLPKPFNKLQLAAAVARAVSASVPAVVDDEAVTALDAGVIDSLARLGDAAGEDLVSQLSELFLADADVQLAALRHAAAHGDKPGLFRAAHTLAGASANVGAAYLARLCDALTPTEVADSRLIPQAVEAVEEELMRVRGAFASMARAS